LHLLFILDQFIAHGPLRRVPQDINPDSSTKSAPVGSVSPKVNKLPTPNTEKTAPESPKPPSPGGTQGSTCACGALPSLPIQAASSPNPTGASSGSEPTESP
jgi:hypothetical protein